MNRAQQLFGAGVQLVDDLERARALIQTQTRVGIQQRERIELLENEIKKRTSQRNFWKDRAERAAELLRCFKEPPFPEPAGQQWKADRDQWLAGDPSQNLPHNCDCPCADCYERRVKAGVE